MIDLDQIKSMLDKHAPKYGAKNLRIENNHLLFEHSDGTGSVNMSVAIAEEMISHIKRRIVNA